THTRLDPLICKPSSIHFACVLPRSHTSFALSDRVGYRSSPRQTAVANWRAASRPFSSLCIHALYGCFELSFANQRQVAAPPRRRALKECVRSVTVPGAYRSTADVFTLAGAGRAWRGLGSGFIERTGRTALLFIIAAEIPAESVIWVLYGVCNQEVLR